MRKLNEVMDAARDDPPFSNGTEGEIWMGRWCGNCYHPVEKAWQDYEAGKRETQLEGYEGGCPLIMAAYSGVTPSEWLEQEDGFHCVEFRGPDYDGEPQPLPDPTGMDGLFDEPERGVRMLKVAEESVLADW